MERELVLQRAEFQVALANAQKEWHEWELSLQGKINTLRLVVTIEHLSASLSREELLRSQIEVRDLRYELERLSYPSTSSSAPVALAFPLFMSSTSPIPTDSLARLGPSDLGLNLLAGVGSLDLRLDLLTELGSPDLRIDLLAGVRSPDLDLDIRLRFPDLGLDIGISTPNSGPIVEWGVPT